MRTKNFIDLKVFLKILATLYFVGAILHLLDIFDLRLKFSEMGNLRKFWIVYLALADLLAAFGLWKNKVWGEFLFVFIAVTQLIAYVGFSQIFFDQSFLIAFHMVCLSFYVFLKYKESR